HLAAPAPVGARFRGEAAVGAAPASRAGERCAGDRRGCARGEERAAVSELGGRHAPASRGVGDVARGSADRAAGAAGGGFAPSALSFRSVLCDEVSSTNDEVKRAIDAGEAEGLVVRALRQSGGYGRQGRVWASPEGGLYCSLLLRPQVTPAALPTLSLV